jgi:hypothetical protein
MAEDVSFMRWLASSRRRLWVPAVAEDKVVQRRKEKGATGLEDKRPSAAYPSKCRKAWGFRVVDMASGAESKEDVSSIPLGHDSQRLAFDIAEVPVGEWAPKSGDQFGQRQTPEVGGGCYTESLDDALPQCSSAGTNLVRDEANHLGGHSGTGNVRFSRSLSVWVEVLVCSISECFFAFRSYQLCEGLRVQGTEGAEGFD